MKRIIDIITAATKHLSEKGFENSRLEVEQMLGSVLGLSRLDLYMAFDRLLEEPELENFRSLYRRRLAHEPLQYIIGSTGFREIEIKTDRRALIPRPETELLVECALPYLRTCEKPSAADIGTGSGIIALSIAYELENAFIVAVDSSEDALRLAEQNALQLGLENRIRFVLGDMLDGLDSGSKFDAILSNPPYIKTTDIEHLQPEITVFEPESALDGGKDGLRYLSVLACWAHHHLRLGGRLFLECGDGQADSVANELENNRNYSEIDIVKDYAGHERIIKAKYKG